MKYSNKIYITQISNARIISHTKQTHKSAPSGLKMLNYFKPLIFLLFGLSYSQYLISQNEFKIWYFGAKAGLNFSVSPAAAINDNNNMGTPEGCAVISDSNGNLLFYTEGLNIISKSHTLMANGSGLFGNMSSTQGAVIVKQPGNTNIYYVFTVYANPACYNIVDMNLAAGFGSVTVKNATLYGQTTEKQVVIRHCNGKDAWIISHERNTNNFRAYLLSSAGLNTTAIISSIGEVINGYSALGQLKISPDGRKLAMACNGPATVTALGNGGFQLFDFNAATGVISNSLVISSVVGAYGVEFSPDGKLLYGTISPNVNGVNAALYQWNICQSSTAAIVASQYSVGGFSTGFGTAAIQWGIDGKLYIAPNDPSNYYAVHVINSPNNTGAAMGLSLNAISTGTNQVNLGLPNYINSYTKPVPTPFTNTLSCQTASFSVPPVPSFSSGCSTTPYPPSGYMWDFGEPGSGAANTSTATNPVHNYGAVGTYTAMLVLFNNCTNDTLWKVVNIITPSPQPSVAGTFSVCKGDKYTYTVSGGSSYLWYNNSIASTIALNPTVTSVYSVKTTSNGCSVNTSFTVEVNKCLSLEDLQIADFKLQIYPNPADEILNVEFFDYKLQITDWQIEIMNTLGQIVLSIESKSNKAQIDTKGLSEGVYYLRASTSLSTTLSTAGAVVVSKRFVVGR